MQTKWKDIVKSFPTTPFLFVGSGLTRRYLDLPTWEELLKHFAAINSDDQFIFERYMSENDNNYEKVGSAISKDFNTKWFRTPGIRTESEDVYTAVKAGISPFKAELAHFIKQNSIKNETYAEEIALLQKLTEKNISGFITTNYDTFLEDIANGYKTYNSQEELIFSPIQEMAEIFKIHGSVTDPASIVITEEDYQIFNDKCAYLAAKLLTIFMEYPIIFIGYSITDDNIQKILSAIVTCLSKHNVDKLQNRFFFVKRNTNITDDIEIGTYSKEVNGQNIFMTQLETDNFKLIFEPLTEKQSGLPVRTLRFLKEQFYNYTITNVPTKHIYVNEYDPNISDDQICFSIGQNSQLVKRGLVGITTNQYYMSILQDDLLPFNAELILDEAVPVLIRQSGGTLPLFKYLSKSHNQHDELRSRINITKFDDIISKSIKKNREKKCFPDRSVNGIIRHCTIDGVLDRRAIEWLSYLKEDEIDLNQLENFLKDYSKKYPDVLNSNSATNFRRLIRIYDWLKYGK